MCGRFVLRTPPAEIAEHFGLQAVPEWEPRYNIAPTQDVPVVRQTSEAGRELVRARWGLVPYGGPGPGVGPLMINARSESASRKPPFRTCLEHRRCIVPADGFYEWRKIDRTRQPYLIDLGGELFGLAGLWDEWRPETGDPLLSFTILTTDAAPRIAPIHDRMPVMLEQGSYEMWLDPQVAASDLAVLFPPVQDERLEVTPVAHAVNSVQNDGPECVRKAPESIELDLFS